MSKKGWSTQQKRFIKNWSRQVGDLVAEDLTQRYERAEREYKTVAEWLEEKLGEKLED